ncbi:MAG: HEAT repeat domain-containing protein [Gemmatimonadota bacterium]|nr:HEAT repeat domain-containing protein [Gemmatimonadota bacterium]
MYQLKKILLALLLFLCGCSSPHGDYVRQLRSGTVDQRIDAAAFLGAQRVFEAVPHLRAALRDSAAPVRTKAAWALGMLRAKEALRDLIRMLGDKDRDVRQIVAWALMQIEEPEAILALERAMASEPDAWVKKDMERAVRYLRQFDGEVDVEEGRVRGEFF